MGESERKEIRKEGNGIRGTTVHSYYPITQEPRQKYLYFRAKLCTRKEVHLKKPLLRGKTAERVKHKET